MNRCPPRDNFRKIWAFVGTNKTDTLCAGVRINWVRWEGLHCKEFLWEIKLTLNKWTKMGKSYQKCKDIVPRRLSLSLYEVSGWFTPRSTFKPASLLFQISRSKCTQFLGYVHNRKLTEQRRFWATRVNQKWAFFSLNMLWRYQICMAKCPYSKRDDLPKNL